MVSTPTDKNWPEVRHINSYAMSIAYLSMGVRGLSYLVITWTTVVLLGGFVSVLRAKDFWSLTIIILAQTAGVFDISLREKLSKFDHVLKCLHDCCESWNYRCLGSVYDVRPLDNPSNPATCTARILRLLLPLCFLLFLLCYIPIALAIVALAFILAWVPPLAFLSIAACLAAVYWLGLFISAGISLWRLIEQDYGDPDDGSNANLKPALLLLYSLALVQGLIFSYRAYFSLANKHDVVKKVAESYMFAGDKKLVKLISGYREDTKIGCEKDITFIQGRNLITYAVDMIQSDSEAPAKVISGVRILQKFTHDDSVEHHKLVKHLIGSTSSSRILHRLVQMLHPEYPYSPAIRPHAAFIVEHLADDVQLEQLPRGIQCITSLLTSDEAEQGLRILRKLAWDEKELAWDEENCRVMSSTQGLVSKIMATLRSHEVHSQHHDERSKMATATFPLLMVLIYAPGEAGQKLRREIYGNTQASTVLECDRCYASLQEEDISMLSRLLFHASASSIGISTEQTQRRRFIQILIEIFADHSKQSEARKKAGALLAGKYTKATITFSTILEAANGTAVSKLTGVLLDTTNDNTFRTSAACILKNLSSHYTKKDDDRFEKLKGGMLADIMPEVLREILCYGRTADGKQTAAEAENTKEFSPSDDLEKGAVSQDNPQNASSSSQRKNRQQEERELLQALVSLCTTVHDKFTTSEAHPGLARQFDDIAAAICLELKRPVETFTHLLEDAQQRLNAKITPELATVPAAASAETRS